MATRRITSSLEDYLEAILHLMQRDDRARVRDIAERLDVGKPAVTAALRKLSDRGLVQYEPYKRIALTDAGRRLAEDVARRHRVIKGFLIDVLGLDGQAAERNACRMEHAIDPQLRRRLTGLAEYIASAPPRHRQWITRFAEQAPEGTS